MNVNLHNGETQTLIRADIDLRECFPEWSDIEYHAARDALLSVGRYWAGGGAAPLFYLTRSR